MVEWVLAKVGLNAVSYAGVGLLGLAVAWGLKRVPNDALKAKLGAFMYGAGVTCTLGLAKWKWTKGIWNKVVEPWVVDAVDNILVTGISKFVEGLRSDNA